jgi:Zn-dependent protease with chaperone function
MLRVNGYYGHVRRNDFLSVALFIGFLIGLHLVAAGLLAVPLMFIHLDSSWLTSPAAYMKTYGLGITLAGSLWFAWQFFDHVRIVEHSTGYARLTPQQSPRLYRIVEPLAITAGIAVPAIAIIESEARNAFACGMSRNKGVVVVTRGLLHALSNDELEAVIAHEITHIATNDTRLLAAANIMLSTILSIQKRNPLRVKSGKRTLVYLFMPPILIMSMIVTAITNIGLMVAKISRLAIASSREYIADAEAVRLTHKPAALISALRKIENCSSVADIDVAMEAMMIDGDTTGEFATHPTIEERISVLRQHSGSMAATAFASDRLAAETVSLPKPIFGLADMEARLAGLEQEASNAPISSLRALRALGTKASITNETALKSAASANWKRPALLASNLPIFAGSSRNADYAPSYSSAPQGKLAKLISAITNSSEVSVASMSLAKRVSVGSDTDLFGLTKKVRYAIIAGVGVITLLPHLLGAF